MSNNIFNNAVINFKDYIINYDNLSQLSAGLYYYNSDFTGEVYGAGNSYNNQSAQPWGYNYYRTGDTSALKSFSHQINFTSTAVIDVQSSLFNFAASPIFIDPYILNKYATKTYCLSIADTNSSKIFITLKDIIINNSNLTIYTQRGGALLPPPQSTTTSSTTIGSTTTTLSPILKQVGITSNLGGNTFGVPVGTVFSQVIYFNNQNPFNITIPIVSLTNTVNDIQYGSSTVLNNNIFTSVTKQSKQISIFAATADATDLNDYYCSQNITNTHNTTLSSSIFYQIDKNMFVTVKNNTIQIGLQAPVKINNNIQLNNFYYLDDFLGQKILNYVAQQGSFGQLKDSDGNIIPLATLQSYLKAFLIVQQNQFTTTTASTTTTTQSPTQEYNINDIILNINNYACSAKAVKGISTLNISVIPNILNVRVPDTEILTLIQDVYSAISQLELEINATNGSIYACTVLGPEAQLDIFGFAFPALPQYAQYFTKLLGQLQGLVSVYQGILSAAFSASTFTEINDVYKKLAATELQQMQFNYDTNIIIYASSSPPYPNAPPRPTINNAVVLPIPPTARSSDATIMADGNTDDGTIYLDNLKLSNNLLNKNLTYDKFGDEIARSTLQISGIETDEVETSGNVESYIDNYITNRTNQPNGGIKIVVDVQGMVIFDSGYLTLTDNSKTCCYTLMNTVGSGSAIINLSTPYQSAIDYNSYYNTLDGNRDYNGLVDINNINYFQTIDPNFKNNLNIYNLDKNVILNNYLNNADFVNAINIASAANAQQLASDYSTLISAIDIFIAALISQNNIITSCQNKILHTTDPNQIAALQQQITNAQLAILSETTVIQTASLLVLNKLSSNVYTLIPQNLYSNLNITSLLKNFNNLSQSINTPIVSNYFNFFNNNDENIRISPPLSVSRDTFSFVVADEEILVNFKTKVVLDSNGATDIGKIPLNILNISKENNNYNQQDILNGDFSKITDQGIFKNFYQDTDFASLRADYLTDINDPRSCSKFIGGYQFSYNENAINKSAIQKIVNDTGLQRFSPGQKFSNQFIGNPCNSSKVVLEGVQTGDYIYVTGIFAKKIYHRIQCQKHTSSTGTVINEGFIYKLVPNFVNNKYQDQWRLSQIEQDASFSYRRFMRTFVADNPLLISDDLNNTEELFYAGDTVGIKLFKVNFNGEITSQLLVPISTLTVNGKIVPWYNLYLSNVYYLLTSSGILNIQSTTSTSTSSSTTSTTNSPTLNANTSVPIFSYPSSFELQNYLSLTDDTIYSLTAALAPPTPITTTSTSSSSTTSTVSPTTTQSPTIMPDAALNQAMVKFTKALTSGMIFDISDITNVIKDKDKIPYVRLLAQAIMFAKGISQKQSSLGFRK